MLRGLGTEATVTLNQVHHQRHLGAEEDFQQVLWPLQECQDSHNPQDCLEKYKDYNHAEFDQNPLVQVSNSANILTTGLAMEKKKNKGGGSRGHSPCRDF